VMSAAGFAESRAGRGTSEWRFASGRSLLEGFGRGTVRTAGLIAAQPPPPLPAIEAAIARRLVPYRHPEGFAVPTVAILGSAERP